MKNNAKGQQESKKGHGKGELILVVDDEATIRNITTILLRKNGYTTLVASDGKEAIALYEQEQANIKLVILDLMMPVMDGEACIQALRAINPDVKIIGVSGLAKYDVSPEIVAMLSSFLQKPFTSEEMLDVIRTIL